MYKYHSKIKSNLKHKLCENSDRNSGFLRSVSGRRKKPIYYKYTNVFYSSVFLDAFN